MAKPKFIQIITGEYSYVDWIEHHETRNIIPVKKTSHAIYGLDSNGDVYKYIPKKGNWVILEDTIDSSTY